MDRGAVFRLRALETRQLAMITADRAMAEILRRLAVAYDDAAAAVDPTAVGADDLMTKGSGGARP
jgi:hypothetical protein